MRAACSFSTSVCGPFWKKNGMLPPPGINHFLHATFPPVFLPLWYPPGITQTLEQVPMLGKACSPSLGFTLQLASRIITSTEIHFVICGTSPSIISRSMLVWELLDKVPWVGAILVVVNLDRWSESISAVKLMKVLVCQASQTCY